MATYALPSLLAFAINLSLVIIILLDNPKSHTHRLFALLMFCFVLWDVADIVVVAGGTAEAASLGGMIIVPALLFASAFYLVLSFSFPRSIHSRFDRLSTRPLFLVLPVLFSFLAGLGIMQPLEFHRIAPQDVYRYGVNTSGGILDAAMYAMVFAYLAWGVANLTGQLRSSSLSKERRQIVYVLSATIGFALLVILLDALRSHEDIHFYATRGMFLVISLLFAYVVLGNRLLILRRLGRKGVAYSLLTGVVFAFYLMVIKNIAGILGEQLHVHSLVMEGLLILALAFAFHPLVIPIQSRVEYLLRQSAFRRRQEFLKLSRELFHLTSNADVGTAVRIFAKGSLLAGDADLMVAEMDPGEYRSVFVPQRRLSLQGPLGGLQEDAGKAFSISALVGGCTNAHLEVLGAFQDGYMLLLRGKEAVVGVLLLGGKSAGAYTVEEEEFLSVLANEVANAVGRNLLLERLHGEELRTAHMEKLAALGQLTAGIAHEFRNPLSIIGTSAQTILHNPANTARIAELGRYILEETRRLDRTVDDFLQFAKRHTPVWQQVSLDELIDRVVATFDRRGRTPGIRIRRTPSEALPTMTTSPRHVERALMNLGQNAVEAMPNGGDLVFAARRRDDSVVISVADTGPGIPPELQKRILDPFVTTKPSGTGLGLPIVAMMIQTVQGEMSFESGPSGTIFTIVLPITPTHP